MKDLYVEIPKRFKRKLSKRFNPKNAEQWDFMSKRSRRIPVPCALCLTYAKDSCSDCPFYKFQKGDAGCNVWLEEINKDADFNYRCIKIRINHIWWWQEDNETAMQFFKLVRKKAKKYIKWI